MDPAAETLATYDSHAAAIADHWWGNRLEAQMRSFCVLLPGRRVVDVGCGAGRDLAWLGELGLDAVGLDRSEGMLAEARRRVPSGRILQGSFTSLPLATASVDGAWVCSSLVHVDNDVARIVLKEIARALVPGGAMYVGVEQGSGWEWRVERDGARRAYYFWDAVALAYAVTDTGMTVVEQFVEHVRPWRFLTTLATRNIDEP